MKFKFLAVAACVLSLYPLAVRAQSAGDLFFLGNQAFSTQNYKTAERYFTQAIAAGWNSSDIYLQRARARHELGDLAGAESDLTWMVEHSSVCPATTLQMRGVVRRERKDADGAIADLTASLKCAPDSDSVYLDRALAYQVKDDYAHSMADLTKVISMEGRMADSALALRGKAYIKSGDRVRGMADLNTLVSKQSGNPAAYRERAMAYMQLKDMPNAGADLATARELSPDDPDVLHWSGHYYFQLGKYEEARTAWTAAIQNGAASWDLLNDRANVSMATGDCAAAAEDSAKAIALNKEHLNLRRLNAWANLCVGRGKEAHQASEAAISLRAVGDPLPMFDILGGYLGLLKSGDKQGMSDYLLDWGSILDGSKAWDGKLALYMNGQLSAPGLLAAAGQDKDHLIWSHLVIAERSLDKKDTTNALLHFRWVKANATNRFEAILADAELKSLMKAN